MGAKRILAMIEVTYAAGDGRTWDELKAVTRGAIGDGLYEVSGALASYVVTGAAVDPDPEPSVPEEPDPREQQG